MISAVWEIISAFGGKIIYMLSMVSGIGVLYKNAPEQLVFLHILFCLTLIGAYMNTYMFNPTNDKFYAMILMRMDAKAYTLSNYIYAILKVVIGFLPFTIAFGLARHVPLWLCILLPFFIAGTKMTVAWLFLLRYKRTGLYVNENAPLKFAWPLAGLLLAAAYGLPYFGIAIPVSAFVVFSVLFIGTGVWSAIEIFRFGAYREMYQQMLADKKTGMDQKQMVKKAVEDQSRKVISQDTRITSTKKGFEYFNDLFIKRHKKILWRPAKRVAAIALILVAGLLFLFRLNPDIMKVTNEVLMGSLPYFVFVMYLINRGTAFTQALFMNCDHSMLSYSFYKKPAFILKLFRIRLWEIMKVNLLPASVIGLGLPLLLYCSGGTDRPLDYVLLLVSILAMSIFFSVHYLVCYYLLQPYNVSAEMKSGTYKLVIWLTYMVCFVFMQFRIDTLVFGILVTCFCIIYCIAACILVYKLAYRTFKLR